MTAPQQPYLNDADCQLFHGDALDVLRGMDADSVDCVVTSPPYWSLRDYQTEGQLGLEETPELYVTRMVEVFREVRRVLAPHGTCWVNLGDSYASSPPGNVRGVGETSGLAGADSDKYRATLMAGHATKRNTVVGDLKPKDLVGIPWRVAFALQADGWWLRSDIVWAKPNPMPESVTDRPTKSHEYVFLLTKQPRYFFDQEAVREKYDDPERVARRAEVSGPGTYVYTDGERARGPDGRRATAVQGADGSLQHRDGERWPNPSGRNVRSVWTIATQPYPEAHFATYPEELVRRCVLAGCPERVCRTCGKASERIVETVALGERHISPKDENSDRNDSPSLSSTTRLHNQYFDYRRTDLGWSDCGHNDWRPGLVLDPFAGSGTTCLVARNHGRHSVGIDLNADYLALAATRLQQLSLLAGEAHASQ